MPPRQSESVRAAALHTRAIELRARGRLKEAEHACRQAVTLFQRAEGKDSLDALHARVELGEMAELRGDLANAVALLQGCAPALRKVASREDTTEDVRGLYLRATLAAARVRQLRGEYAAVE